MSYYCKLSSEERDVWYKVHGEEGTPIHNSETDQEPIRDRCDTLPCTCFLRNFSFNRAVCKSYLYSQQVFGRSSIFYCVQIDVQLLRLSSQSNRIGVTEPER